MIIILKLITALIAEVLVDGCPQTKGSKICCEF